MKIKYKPRKIVCANYSFFISLPIDWVRNHNIGKGDLVSSEIQEDGSLSLRPLNKND